MAKKQQHHYEDAHGGNAVFCIPAGLFLGIGIGMLYSAPGAGFMIGMGAGFLGWAILGSLKK